MLADAVKIRRSPDMRLDRQELETELRWIAATNYFAKNAFKKPYFGKLLERHRDATPANIDNYRIGYLAYEYGEYERTITILEPLDNKDADRKSDVEGKSVSVRVILVGGRSIKKKKNSERRIK